MSSLDSVTGKENWSLRTGMHITMGEQGEMKEEKRVGERLDVNYSLYICS